MEFEFFLHRILCSYEKIRKTKKKKLSSHNVIDPERIRKHNALGFEMFGGNIYFSY